MADGSPGVLRNALNHIKNILITPIKPYGSTGIPDSSSVASASFGQGLHPESPTESEQGSGTVPEGDLPGQITRFMGKSKCDYLARSSSKITFQLFRFVPRLHSASTSSLV